MIGLGTQVHYSVSQVLLDLVLRFGEFKQDKWIGINLKIAVSAIFLTNFQRLLTVSSTDYRQAHNPSFDASI